MTTTHVIFLLCTIAVLGAQLRAESAPAAQKPRIVTAKELNEGTAVIIGDLGVPLITAVEIVATVEEELSPLPREARRAAPSDRHLCIEGRRDQREKVGGAANAQIFSVPCDECRGGAE